MFVGGKEQVVEAEKVLVAVGFKPNSAGIGLESAGVKLDERGHIAIDDQMRTNVPSIFAIGDVAGMPYLAHKASKEGEIAAEVIAGHDPQLEKAIEVILEELEVNPPTRLERPPYPVRVWQE